MRQLLNHLLTILQIAVNEINSPSQIVKCTDFRRLWLMIGFKMESAEALNFLTMRLSYMCV